MLALIAQMIARMVPGIDGYKTILGLLLTGGVAAVEQTFGLDLPDWMQIFGMGLSGAGMTHKVMKAQTASLAGMELLPGGFSGRLKEWSTWGGLAALVAIIFGGDADTIQAAFEQLFAQSELWLGALASVLALFEAQPDKR